MTSCVKHHALEHRLRHPGRPGPSRQLRSRPSADEWALPQAPQGLRRVSARLDAPGSRGAWPSRIAPATRGARSPRTNSLLHDDGAPLAHAQPPLDDRGRRTARHSAIDSSPPRQTRRVAGPPGRSPVALPPRAHRRGNRTPGRPVRLAVAERRDSPLSATPLRYSAHVRGRHKAGT